MSNQIQSDNILLERLRQKEEEAWVLLYKKGNYQAVKNYVLNNSGKEADAKDIYQDALIVLYKKTLGGNFTLTSALSTYIFGVAKNLWYKRLNKKKRIANVDISNYESLLSEEFSISEGKIIEDKINEVKLAVDKIGDPCQSLLYLFYFNKLSMEEIAKQLSYNSSKTAKQQKYKCMTRLRKMLNL